MHPDTDHIRRRNEAFVFLLAHALELGVPGLTEPAADFIVRMPMCISRRKSIPRGVERFS